MDKELKKHIFMSPLRILGILKLHNWLWNKNKLFSPKEIFINWVLALSIIFAILSGLVFSFLTTDINEIHFSNLSQIKFNGVQSTFGAIGFILFIVSLTTWPFKTYFRIKRKSLEIKEKKGKDE